MSLHPLTKLIEKGDNPYSPECLDTIITTYLKGRAEWLKKQWMKDVDFTIELIDTAFELDEKCEEYCECGHQVHYTTGCNNLHCGSCGLPKKPKPTLPSHLPNAWQTGDMMKVSMYLSEVAIKVNDIIDYLHTKEAR